MQAELQVELLQERPVDSEWPASAMRSEHAGVEAVTEEAKWSAADIRGVQTSSKVSSRTVEPEVPVPSRCGIQSSRAQLPQERLRSSWVPTSILLYSFCCSSLKVSFTLPRFSPPSLQKIAKWVVHGMIMYCWYTSLRLVNCLSELQVSLTYTQHGCWRSLH